uniref:Uncharacterized protein n=1 Tax=Pavo cristatus TaxID=9049 RepID=A0A8C9EJP7_PAVCR
MKGLNSHLVQYLEFRIICAIVNEILRLNEDTNVQGLALDLPESLYSSKILNAVKPEKDVDGLSDVNLGRLVRGEGSDYLVSPAAGALNAARGFVGLGASCML